MQTAAQLTRFVDAGAVRLAVRESGRGVPVLCLHATGHGARDFDRFATRVGDRFRVVALDWPGQGESPSMAQPASAQAYAAILDHVAHALEIERYILLGNSIGGAAAMIHAARRPERVRGLVLCNPGGLQPVNFIARLYCGAMVRQFSRGERGDPRFGPWFERYYRGILQSPDAGWRRDEIVAEGYARARVLREAWESFGDPAADIRDLPAQITCPVLYAWAKGDQAVAWSRSAKAARRAPNAEITLFDGGHAAFLEQPEAFASAFERLATRLPA